MEKGEDGLLDTPLLHYLILFHLFFSTYLLIRPLLSLLPSWLPTSHPSLRSIGLGELSQVWQESRDTADIYSALQFIKHVHVILSHNSYGGGRECSIIFFQNQLRLYLLNSYYILKTVLGDILYSGPLLIWYGGFVKL